MSLRNVPFELNGPLIGRAMRDVVQRAMKAIRAKRFTFVAREKGLKADGKVDWVTDVDELAQGIYVKLLSESFPGFGIIGEEDELNVPCSIPGTDIYFTIDPIDGTSQFKRLESHGIGSMLALVMNGEVIAVCIGDVMTGELYYYRPGSEKTHRLDQGIAVPLVIDPNKPLIEQYVHLREPVDWPGHHTLMKRLGTHSNGLFRGTEVGGGSIGISMARLWKGSIGACVISSRKVTPWDDTPIIGLSRRLGFRWFKPARDFHGFLEIDPRPHKEVLTPDIPDTLIFHTSRIGEFMTWCTDEAIDIKLLPDF